MREGRVFTTITVDVTEQLKGETGTSLEILQPGGRTDDLMTYVPGMPDFVVGEHVLLFLEKPPTVSHYVVTGLSQGKFKILATDTNDPIVEQGVTELHRVEPPPITGPLPFDILRYRKNDAASATSPLSLPEFRRQIRQLLGKEQ